jgi:hypothetical protein
MSNDDTLPAGSLSVVNNIFFTATGKTNLGGDTGFNGSEGTWANDLWFNGTDAVPSFATAAQHADPKFVTAGTDYHLGTGSAALGTGSSTTSTLVKDDLFGTLRPSPNDIGAVGKAN